MIIAFILKCLDFLIFGNRYKICVAAILYLEDFRTFFKKYETIDFRTFEDLENKIYTDFLKIFRYLHNN